MNELFVIDIPEENYTTIAAGQGKKEAIEVDDGDDALMLEDLDVKDKSIEGEEVEPEMLPLPEPRMFPLPTTCVMSDPSRNPHPAPEMTNYSWFFFS
jgi:hypothetical protein